MTAKHFNTVAKVFNEALQRASADYEILALETIAKDLAKEFKVVNERFKENYFLSACGVKTTA